MEKKWRCTVCGYVHTGDNPPEKCPLCKAPASKFVEIKEDANEISWADGHTLGVAKGCDQEAATRKYGKACRHTSQANALK